MNRVLRAGKVDSPVLLSDITRMFLFENDDQSEEFVTHCGLEITYNQSGETDEDIKYVMLNGKNIMDQLPRKKSTKPNEVSNEPELPIVHMMFYYIEDKVEEFTRADICQGFATDSTIFDELLQNDNDNDDNYEDINDKNQEEVQEDEDTDINTSQEDNKINNNINDDDDDDD
eukprot:CAMPEP_0174826238 /NCGR_PEP_ID=MMETSP1107-20130205/43718_1 /TAXON_ID=36770 /ORGANISM="Paraphysomonas vestita, Strain GFlagA" /LENGTH=172 /DNA_ID=CAMNT_0016058967 /DNA_START=1267 /DNA_END=1782 /DNA_ORIENTATION=+